MALALFVVAGLCLCFSLDSLVARWWLEHDARAGLKQGDLYRLFRVMGYLPTWVLVGAAIMLIRPVSRRLDLQHLRWSFAPLISGAIAGAIATILKLVLRRVRADHVQGAWYVFREFTDGPLTSSGLSMPSEHTAVAFGAAVMLSWMYPRARPVFILMALGCGVTRITHADHYLSDVYVGGLIGMGIAWMLWRLSTRFIQSNSVNEALVA